MAFSSSSCLFTPPNLTTKAHSHRTVSAHFATATLNTTRSSTPSSLYEVLGIQMGADKGEIKAAYRKLARIYHPDVGSHDSSADEFMKVHSAYATLSDPGKRADYDRTLFVRPKMTVGYSGYSGRRWETDQCW
ncbi:DnaJ domain-containing protein [Tanacetum coccineum]